jgi:chorismate mutase
MSIEDWRSEIDSIDKELLRLLNSRARLALKVGALKREVGLPLCDKDREQDIIDKICLANPGPLDERAVTRLFRRIIFESRRVEACLTKAGIAPSMQEAIR